MKYHQFLSLPFLLLLLGNFYCIYYFTTHANGFDTVIWIYWSQSMIIGLFNFLDLLTVKNFDANDLKINGQPMQKGKNGCAAFFFLFHYGMFHLVYFIFIATRLGLQSAISKVVLIGILLFLVESLVSFLYRKRMEQTRTINYGVLFILPYLRIIPMHIFIMIPVFMGIGGSILFLILKFIADILSFISYGRLFKKNLTAR